MVAEVSLAPATSQPGIAMRLVLMVVRNPTIAIGALILGVLVILAAAAPWYAGDPLTMQPRVRFRPPSEAYAFGTDNLGRDIFARTMWGARVSLLVGFLVAFFATSIGLLLGLLCGWYRWVDAVVMRVMDGIMAIPAILLAIALIALVQASLLLVVVAILIPEIPRVVRLVRAIVLSVREQPYVEAAIAGGTKTPKLLLRHVLPNTVGPLIVTATYICAAAILTEAGLSFLGAGVPPELPSWGNLIASGRTFFQRAPWIILIPGGFLALTVLAVNLLGDGLRDRLDPRVARRL